MKVLLLCIILVFCVNYAFCYTTSPRVFSKYDNMNYLEIEVNGYRFVPEYCFYYSPIIGYNIDTMLLFFGINNLYSQDINLNIYFKKSINIVRYDNFIRLLDNSIVFRDNINYISYVQSYYPLYIKLDWFEYDILTGNFLLIGKVFSDFLEEGCVNGTFMFGFDEFYFIKQTNELSSFVYMILGLFLLSIFVFLRGRNL